jgi:hypothetical protein
LQEWFADHVDERDGIYYFSWNGSEDTAEIMDSEEEKFIRFHWSHAPKGEYFEFAIEKSEVTNQTILVIKDFAEKKEIKDQSRLWDHQVKDLFHFGQRLQDGPKKIVPDEGTLSQQLAFKAFQQPADTRKNPVLR